MAPVFCQQTQRSLEEAAHQHRSHHGRITVVGGDGAEHGDEGKADAHDHRQPGTDSPDGIQLNQRGDTRDEHGVLKQNRGLGLAQRGLGRPGDNGDRRQVRDEHGQDMLESEGNRFPQRHSALQPVDVIDTAIRIAVHDLLPPDFVFSIQRAAYAACGPCRFRLTPPPDGWSGKPPPQSAPWRLRYSHTPCTGTDGRKSVS